MAEVEIGINKMIITGPGLCVKPEELAKPLSEQELESSLRKDREAARKEGKEWHEPTKEQLNEMRTKKVADTVGKIRKGLGVETIRLAGHSESNATFVADAIYEFARKIMQEKDALAKLRAEPVRTIYYATESNPDRSRPELEVSLLMASSKLLDEDEKKYREIVEMFRHAKVVPVTYACVGGVVSLHEAATRVHMSTHEARPESAIVVSADTAYYDSRKAPGAEATQGAAAALMWITSSPRLVAVDSRFGSYHVTLSDFTKFVDETPEVHGRFSEMAYVFTVARALESLEEELGHGKGRNATLLNELDFFICHVPFPKQAEYLTSFLFVHWIKNHNPKLYTDIQAREGVGNEPLGAYTHLTDLMESKFRLFNAAPGTTRHEQEIISHIENDPEIRAYWDWLKVVRKAPEFEEFLKDLHVRDALKIPSNVGNSYSNSIFVSMASLLQHVYGVQGAQGGATGVMAGYGSGAQAMTYIIKVMAGPESVKRDLSVLLNDNPKYQLSADQYLELHGSQIKGDSIRLTSGEDLVEKDKRMLRSETLPQGFHVRKRNKDGTGEYVYSDGSKIVPVKIRF